MPYATISIGARLSSQAADQLSRQLIRLLAQDLGKDPELSVVRVSQSGAFHLMKDTGRPGLTAVEVHITAGTTTAEQQAAFIEHTHEALESMGLGEHPSYVIVHEHDAQAWGYGGTTQATRQASRLNES